jgi:SAM-dependent methyltransferase
MWEGSFNKSESTLHQLAPYVGKLKSGMVKVLLEYFSEENDVVLDPFCGSGVVPLEALLRGRKAIGNDLNLYAFTITMGKVRVPSDLDVALADAGKLIEYVEKNKNEVDITSVDEWVAEFFHSETLREVVTAFEYLRAEHDYFLTACLLGILHHVRPGFLSYPASHLTPYLRKNKYPPERFPEMYSYRALAPRIEAKVKRAYKRPMISRKWVRSDYDIYMTNSRKLPVGSESVDLILSSPPYFGALDYARDNRLRLWFLGERDWKSLDKRLTSNDKVYAPQMEECVSEMYRVLKAGKYCVLVLGDVSRNGKTKDTAAIIADIAFRVSGGKLITVDLIRDEIPDDRRSRRRTKTTKNEKVLVLYKSG